MDEPTERVARISDVAGTIDGENGAPRPSAPTRVVGPVSGPNAPTGAAPTIPVPQATTRLTAPIVPPTRSAVPLVPNAASVTAEIPAVMVSNTRMIGGPDDHFRERRRAAPYGVRAFVWLLFFILLLGLGVIAVEHVHPTWLNFARATKSSPAALSPELSTTTTGVTTTVPVTSMRLASKTAKIATYDIPHGAYSLIVTTHNPCWTTVNVPPGSKTIVFEQTILPSESPKQIPLTGSSTVTFSAQATSVAVMSGGKVLGTIPTPTEYPFTYVFDNGS